MEHTPNYRLSQWNMADRIQMQDFNADNQKIDAALKAKANTRAAAVQTLTNKVAKCGNCRMEVFTYTDTGAAGVDNPTRITFSARPTVFFVMDDRAFLSGQGSAAKGNRIVYNPGSSSTSMGATDLTWSGNTMSLYTTNNANSQLNTKDTLYCVLALYKMD